MLAQLSPEWQDGCLNHLLIICFVVFGWIWKPHPQLLTCLISHQRKNKQVFKVIIGQVDCQMLHLLEHHVLHIHCFNRLHRGKLFPATWNHVSMTELWPGGRAAVGDRRVGFLDTPVMFRSEHGWDGQPLPHQRVNLCRQVGRWDVV